MSESLLLVPIGDVPEQQLHKLAASLIDYGQPSRILAPWQPNQASYNAHRQQYRADLLLDGLRRHAEPNNRSRVLGVLNRDMYVYVLDYIKGFADLPGRAALISLARLQAEPARLVQRAMKLAMHELGHTRGLEHCTDAGCVMHAAECMQDMDDAGDCLCSQCQQKLLQKQQLYAGMI